MSSEREKIGIMRDFVLERVTMEIKESFKTVAEIRKGRNKKDLVCLED